MENQCIDIMIIQETWLRKCDSAIINDIKEFGYKLLTYRKSRKLDLGGGVAMMYRNNIKIHPMKTTSSYHSFEHLTGKLMTKEGAILIVTVYRPEYSAKNRYTVKHFIDEFKEFLSDINSEVFPSIITGDFNFHVELLATQNDLNLSMYKRTKKKDATMFIKTMQDAGYTQLITDITHDDGGTLDLLFVQDNDMVNSFKVGLKDEVCCSDHYPVHFNIERELVRVEEAHIFQYRNIKMLNHESYVNSLGNLNFYNNIENTDINTCVTIFNNLTNTAMNEQCPIKTITVRKRPAQKWYTDELRNLKRVKRQAERKYIKYRNSSCLNELKAIEDTYSKSIQKTKEEFYYNTTETNRNDLKKLYKVMNNLIEDQEKILPTTDNLLKLADDMGNFYSEKINTIRNNIREYLKEHQHTLPDTTTVTDQQVTPCFNEFHSISHTDLEEVITQMNNKCSLEDTVPMTVLKANLQYFIPVLQEIITKSFVSGVFPTDLKHAVVNPIYKPGGTDPEVYKNYRPVSNILTLSKIIEKVASNQLTSYLNTHNLCPKFQSGYLKGHSCETAMVKVSNDIQKMIYEGKMVIQVILDLSSAFDTVDHNTLLNGLEKRFGISGKALDWIKSYLTGRTFAVKIKQVKGCKILLIYGVPQGSVLGPLLFILYISDLPNIVSKHDILLHCYADDAQLYVGFEPFKNFTNKSNSMKRCINSVDLWMKHNFLQLNVKKTEVLFIGRPNDFNIHHFEIEIGNVNFQSSKSKYVRSLGSYIDSCMSMKPMITECAKSCNFNLRKIKKIRNCLGISSKLLLIKSFILAKLDYCNILLANVPSSYLKPLEKVLKNSLRFVYSLKQRQTVSSYYKESHILPVALRIKYKTSEFVYKIINQLSPSYLNNIIQLKPMSIRNLRSNNDNFILLQSCYSNSIEYAMVSNWNELPYNIRTCSSLKSFKKQLKTHYFNVLENMLL